MTEQMSHEERARLYFNSLKRVRMLTKVNEVETLAHQFRQVENAAYERAIQAACDQVPGDAHVVAWSIRQKIVQAIRALIIQEEE